MEPQVTVDGETATIDCQSVYYKHVNEAIRRCFAEGVKTVKLGFGRYGLSK